MRAEVSPRQFGESHSPSLGQALGVMDWARLHCDSIEVSEAHRPVGFRFCNYIVNIEAELRGQKVLVTGEANTPDLALAKAQSELIERIALFISPECEQSYTSNEWAAHPDREQARKNAVLELVERDAVLGQWYSATPFLQIPTAQLPTDIQAWVASELSRSEYPELQVLLSTKGIGPSVTCIFRNKAGFGVSGSGTRTTLTQAIESALAEACRAAHATLRREYWGDTLKLKNRTSATVNPGAHSVYYAYHEPFPVWIAGPSISWTDAEVYWNGAMARISADIYTFTFRTVLEAPLFAGFAMHPQAFDLRWGATFQDHVLNTAGAQRIGLKCVNEDPQGTSGIGAIRAHQRSLHRRSI